MDTFFPTDKWYWAIHDPEIAETHVLEIRGIQKSNDPFEQMAKELGITVKEQRQRLQKLSA